MKIKWTATNIVALIGFILLFAAFFLGILVAILFAFPNLSIMGMVAVNERDTQVTYRDAVLAEAFARGNFIIESNSCNVEIVMSAAGHNGEGTIVVNESATGIAFNSFSRTLIEWTETQVDGVTYFKIKVIEPNGLVFSSKPTTVYLNLPNQTSLFSFILRNNNSTVNFSFGDTKEDASSQLHIDNLVVESANTVNLPGNKYLDVNNVTLQSNRTKFNCSAAVNKDVLVTGNGGTQAFNSIGGKVTILGNSNNFSAGNTGAVTFTAPTGRLTTNASDGLTVTTTSAQIAVGTVNGAVNMQTDSGNLSVNNITKGGLNFTAATTATVNVGGSLVGDVVIQNNGVGSINLNGVDGDVDINSAVKDGGTITVSFQYDGRTQHQVKILGYDGDIRVDHIYGYTDIRVRDPGPAGAAGRANVVAGFHRVTNEDNIICTGAYVNSPSGMGNITVYLLNDDEGGWNNFDLYVLWARSAWAYPNDELMRLDIGGDVNQLNHINGGMQPPYLYRGRLTVATLADFELR